ncbi:unknown [Clostridium sp. CAG:609]|nr:unknown [Clostridium sp. CAG:609]
MIGRFTNTTPIINNGSIKNITGTNVAYVMPHIIIIKNNKYLMFDECDDTYVNTFKIKISFKDLEGKSHKKITNIYNKENILGKTWKDLIRIIPIKDNDRFKSNQLELAIITINLSNIKGINGTPLYKQIK